MDAYVEKIKAYLAEHTQEEKESVLDAFYYSCPELHGPDEEEIQREFTRLHHVLEKLTLREYDEVWNVVCQLSTKTEKRGFRAGLRSALQLMGELEKGM